MWDHMRMTKKVDMEDMSGLMDVFTKVTSPKMLSNLFFILGMERDVLFIPMDVK